MTYCTSIRYVHQGSRLTLLFLASSLVPRRYVDDAVGVDVKGDLDLRDTSRGWRNTNLHTVTHSYTHSHTQTHSHTHRHARMHARARTHTQAGRQITTGLPRASLTCFTLLWELYHIHRHVRFSNLPFEALYIDSSLPHTIVVPYQLMGYT